MTTIHPDRVEIRMQTPGYGDDCALCDADASGFHAVPMFNGDLMSNDWPGEWGGFPVCESCFLKHERGELPTFDADYRHLLAMSLMDGAGI